MDRGYVPKHDLRIVLLGQAGPWKGFVSKDIVGLWADGSMCLEREESGRTVTMVMTQGWDSEHTGGGAVEQEVMRSVTLCPPGPHALLLSLPIGPDVGITRRDVERAQQHMSFLSEKAWKHTMVVFICTYKIMSNTILLDRHILGQLVDRCGGGHPIIFLDKPSSELLQKADQMAARNRQSFLQHHEVKMPRLTMEAEQLAAFIQNMRNMRGSGSPGPRPATAHHREMPQNDRHIGMVDLLGVFDGCSPELLWCIIIFAGVCLGFIMCLVISLAERICSVYPWLPSVIIGCTSTVVLIFFFSFFLLTSLKWR
ncbi:uncharacterized protein LOC134093675 [Sardina pilchardus]|uniref:uncharacterized protein LOC134093675 n=1 Tax=Sardina pilchardus TaxID=27697 RepID=UPI002E10BF68